MAFDIFGHVIEVVLGPIALVLHLPELGLVIGDFSRIVELAVGGQVGAVIGGVLDGEFAAGSKTVASLIGTLLWIAVIGSLFGELGAFGELGEVFELFD